MEPADCFALFDLPRTAHLDEAVLRDRYHEEVRRLVDPVDGGGEAGRTLHRAHEILADPVQRLRHLLQLLAPERKAGGTGLSGELVALFSETGSLLSRADALLTRLGQTTSALGRAMLAAEEAAVQLGLQSILGKLTLKREEELAGLPEVRVENLEALEAVSGRLRMLQKWQGEVQTRLLRLLTGSPP